MAIIINGRAVAQKLKDEIRAAAGGLSRKPGLAVIMAGDDPASHVYVRNKMKDCEECGITGTTRYLPAGVTQDEVLRHIAELNADDSVDGFMFQHPAPKQIDFEACVRAIDPRKDVDGLHPENIGLYMIGVPRFLPGTPEGIMVLFDEYGIDAAGKECVVVGRSNIVGKPMAMLLLSRHGTVTLCHSRTPDLAAVTRRADILIAATGKMHLITADMVKPGAVVIDVGISLNQDGKMVGDVAFDEVEPIASFITRVTGGVGPMSRVMLMRHTLQAAETRA